MRPRAPIVILLAVCAFVALYAVGVAREEDDDTPTELAPPRALPGNVKPLRDPPELARQQGDSPSLKPARRPQPPPVAAPPPAPVPVAPAPAPEPAPEPVAAPPPPPTPPPSQPFFNER